MAKIPTPSQLQRKYPSEALLSPDPSRRRWAAAGDNGGGGGTKRRHESEASLNLDFETEDQDHQLQGEQIEMQYR